MAGLIRIIVSAIFVFLALFQEEIRFIFLVHIWLQYFSRGGDVTLKITVFALSHRETQHLRVGKTMENAYSKFYVGLRNFKIGT